ncbi:SulP family inorganic anion transporter [Aquicella lusitana]|uniref:SulP family sulfate permease n=1 Tax=Aquicella lusitana TaxID=254246 RepID=A0A370GG72_9COXI|nr:SulP family inorganic anion transporter [Aquicella lusitana]RDI40963.1 SulP family sulfate permease [Aquicella lusitana]VVC73632.1 C4-dicarboxylic acid transporter DauA [Aquicella lusitana]
MLAIIDAYRAGLLRWNNWRPNLISGLIVGVVALPLAMAFAIASGVKPEQGLYTAIIAGFIVGVFGGSRVQIAGPTGAFIVILAHITAQYGVDGLQIATLLAGFVLIFMGILKLGNVIKYIPDPVIVGFTTGIGFIIFVGEWKDFFGFSQTLPLNAAFYQKLIWSFHALPNLNVTTTAIAVLSLLLTILSPRLIKWIPGPLIAMLTATGLQIYFKFDSVATIGSTFGGIPQQLPQFHIPSLTLGHVSGLIGPAFTIALLGAIESLLSATAADGMARTRHYSNQELIGQGLANIAAPLFGGFAATGAIARTATNVRNGGNCPLAAVTHSIFLLLVIIFLAPLASYVPLCALAAILFVVAYNMSDLPHFFHILKRAPRYDVVVLLITFFLTVFTDLVVAVNVGVILAMLFFIRRMSQIVNIEEQTREKLQAELAANGIDTIPSDTIVYTIQGPFFFGAAEKIERALAAAHLDSKTIIFRLKEVPFMDMTGLETFSELIAEYRKRGINIYLCEANDKVKRKLASIGIFRLITKKRVFNTLADAIAISQKGKAPPA